MVFDDYNEGMKVKHGSSIISNNTLAENAPNNEFGDNIVLIGESGGGNVTFAVTGTGQSSVMVQKVTCVSNCSPAIVVDEEDEVDGPRVRYWSEPNDWDNLPGRIPVEDDEVEIMSHWNMIFDIAETPKLKKL